MFLGWAPDYPEPPGAVNGRLREAVKIKVEIDEEDLARVYNKRGCYLGITALCDEVLDRSGALLGRVKDKALRRSWIDERNTPQD